MEYNNNNGYNNYYNNGNNTAYSNAGGNDYNNYYNNMSDNGQYNAQAPTNNYQSVYKPSMQEKTNKSGNGAAITSMIFGIISIVLCCCCGMGFLFGVVAIVFAIISGKKKGKIQGMAIAGLVCGIIGGVLGFGCDLCFWIFGGGIEAVLEGVAEGINDAYYGY